MKGARAWRGGREANSVEILTSRENRWLKEFRAALRGGVPTSGGAVGVEGLRLVEEALTSGCKVEAVLFSESGERWRERLAPLVGRPEMGFPLLRTTDRLFEGIADTEHPQGVAALVVPKLVTLEELAGRNVASEEKRSQQPTADSREVTLRPSEKKHRRLDAKTASGAPTEEEKSRSLAGLGMTGFLDDGAVKAQDPRSKTEGGGVATEEKSGCAALLVVLAGVQDPGNVGTIVRTAAAFGATGVVTAATGQSGTASPFSPKALRASAGAALHLPVLSGMALGILLTQLKMMGVRTVASCAHQESGDALAPWEVKWCEPVALLVGNEGAGLPEEVVHAADGRIHIPMATQVESLNAGAAAAVVLYEAYRQRKAVASDEV
jgi:tRNA G18 (ribose-2'-O)-methylase SpoU